MIARSALALLLGAVAHSCSAPASAADPPAQEPVHMNIEASRADAAAQWERAAGLVSKCAPVDVAIWYSFGSARLRAAPAAGGCRVDLETEVEGDRRTMTCALPAGTAWGWNLVAEGGKARTLPPRDPPADLAAKCRR
jgi:hypothetical protein